MHGCRCLHRSPSHSCLALSACSGWPCRRASCPLSSSSAPSAWTLSPTPCPSHVATASAWPALEGTGTRAEPASALCARRSFVTDPTCTSTEPWGRSPSSLKLWRSSGLAATAVGCPVRVCQSQTSWPLLSSQRHGPVGAHHIAKLPTAAYFRP